MPKIVEKEETLNGEAVIIRYNHRDTYFLRVKRGGKRYTNISLKTTDILTARKEALSAYVPEIEQPSEHEGSGVLQGSSS